MFAISLVALLLTTIQSGDNASLKDITATTLQKAPAGFSVSIDGQKVHFNDDMGHPFLSPTQRTMMPIRIISENMGYKVEWNEKTREVTIEDGQTKATLTIGKSTATINGKSIPIDLQGDKIVDTKAQIVKGRTYVPIRFVAEAFGAEIEYEKKDNTHYINIIRKKEDIKETPSKIEGNVDKMTTQEGFKKVIEYFGESQNKKDNQPSFNPNNGPDADSGFMWISDEKANGGRNEVMIVLTAWYKPEHYDIYVRGGSLAAYQSIPATVKEVLRFYLPNGGADELFKIIDDGYNGRLGNKKVIGVDLRDELGADRSVRITQGAGTRIFIEKKGL